MSENEITEKNENEEVETQETHEHAHGADHDHDHDHGEEEEFKFEEDPVFEIDYKGDCAYQVKVTIPAVNAKAQKSKLLDELQDDAELPGFRKGRAPRKLIEKKFQKAIRGDSTDKLINAAFLKLIKDKDLKPLAIPSVEGLENIDELNEDDPISYSMNFEVFPRCELGKYRGIEIERPVLKTEDADVEERLNDLRGRYAVYETAADAEAQEGDQVIIDFKGIIDGEAFAGGSAQNYPYILGSKRFFAQFEDTLQGARTGQELTCEVPFPSDYSSAQLAGKTATFTINVQEIKRKQLPELDEEFAKQVGAESVENLREKTKTMLQDETKNQCDRVAELRALKTIIADSTFEIPKTMLANMTKDRYEQDCRHLAEMRVSQAEIEKREDEMRAQAEKDALESIKAFVVIREIVSAEGLEVNEDDFEHEAESISGRLGMNMAVVSKFIQDEERRDEYEDRILRRKALDVVISNAAITEKEVTREELEQEDEDDDES